MFIPDLKGIANAILESQSYSDTLTSTLEATASLFAGNTGIFGRRSRQATGRSGRGPSRSDSTALIADDERPFIALETLQDEKSGSTIASDITAAPEPTPFIAELEKRQTTRSSRVSCSGNLQYVSCSDGSFNGCAQGSAICDVTTIKTTSTVILDGPSPTSSTLQSTTNATSQTEASTTNAPSSNGIASPTTTNAAAPTTTSTSSSTTSVPIGAIVGGVIGGIAVLVFAIFLLIFCIKRQRKKIEQRRLAEANPFFQIKKKTSIPPPPPPLHPDQRPNTTHQRNGSTSHDFYGTTFAGGSTSRSRFHNEKNRLIDDMNNSLQANPAPPPGLRAEGGPGLPPAAFLRPAQMLDGKPIVEIGGSERPKSSRGMGVGGSRFEEDLRAVEMEDTSSSSGLRTTTTTLSPAHRTTSREQSSSSLLLSSQDSPILGRNPPAFHNSSSSPTNDGTKRHHLLSWNSYVSNSDGDGDDEEMNATLNSSAKALPSARSSSPWRVQSSGLRLSGDAMGVSPLRKEGF